MHSGMFGGPAPDSLIALCRMIATLHDDKGDVAVKGLETMEYDGAAYDEAAFRTDAGVLAGVDLIGSGSIAERLYGKPSINVIGIDAPEVDGAANALIPKARARVSVRLAPGQEPDDAHAGRQGAPRGGRPLERQGEGHARDQSARASSPRPTARPTRRRRGRWPPPTARTSCTTARAARSRWSPRSSARIPGAEMILWGAEEPQCKIHAPNESVDLGELERCTLAEALFIAGMAEQK